MRTKESKWWQPVIAWGAPTVMVTTWFVAYDLWAGATGHESATHEFKEGLQDQAIGPLIFGLWCGVFAGGCWHLIKGIEK